MYNFLIKSEIILNIQSNLRNLQIEEVIIIFLRPPPQACGGDKNNQKIYSTKSKACNITNIKVIYINKLYNNPLILSSNNINNYRLFRLNKTSYSLNNFYSSFVVGRLQQDPSHNKIVQLVNEPRTRWLVKKSIQSKNQIN